MNTRTLPTMIFRYSYIALSLFLSVGVSVGPLWAQQERGDDGLPGYGDVRERPLSLSEALEEALAQNGDLEVARARTEAAQARSQGASSFLFPALQLEAGAVHSDDPVAVFGTKLRQERFSQSDFRIDALNRPDPVTDWTAGAGATWRILDPSAWAGREAARLGARASELELERRREATVFQTRVLYLQALAADAGVTAAEEALEAARASRDVIRQRRNQGVLTEADVLQAEAEVAGAEAALADRRRGRFQARSRLAVQLGWSGDTLPRPTDGLLTESMVEMSAEEKISPVDLSDRADVRALDRAAEAAGARVGQAVRRRLPAVEAFGGLSTHAAEIGGDRSANWSMGIQLRWPLFTGLARESAIDEARALERAAEAERDQRLRDARAEAAEVGRSLAAAREGARAAEAAAAAALEAQRLVRRRFEEGLTTTAQLFQADARATEMEFRAIEARTNVQIAAARLDFAVGMTSTQP